MATKDSSRSSTELTLKARAEAKLFARQPAVPGATVASANALLHDLQVHQVELEMQNEALREAQAALEESRDRYQNLFEFAPVGYLTLDKNALIDEVNLTGATMLGQPRLSLRHRRFARCIAPDDREEWQRHYFQSVHSGEKQNCEIDLLRPEDGSTLAVILEFQPVTSGGSTALMRIVLMDISRLKKMMDALRESRDRLQLAKTAARLGIFDHNLETGVHYVDERMREIWGLKPDGPLSYEQVMADIHPDDRKATQSAIERARDPAGDGVYCAGFRVVSQLDGQVRHVAANGQVYFRRGRLARFVGTVRDVTALMLLQKEASQRRNEMDRLAKQQVAVQTMAAIAHEMNQPLTSISAYGEAALNILRDGSKQPEKLQRAIEGVVEQAQRAGASVHELLALLQQTEVTSETVDLGGLIRDAVSIAAESGFGEIGTTIDLEHGLRPVWANRLQIQKVLLNLLNNSAEAMSCASATRGAISITVRQQAADCMAVVTVTDCGEGLDPSDAQRVFTPFFTTRKDGVGLGLVISRALVEANGGKLWLEPKTGSGATFSFTLPIAP